MCNKAQAIETLVSDVFEAEEMASRYAITKDQNWTEEETLYIFDDSSVLKIQNQFFNSVNVEQMETA